MNVLGNNIRTIYLTEHIFDNYGIIKLPFDQMETFFIGPQ